MKYRHQSFDARGASVSGEIDAIDSSQASELLRKKGWFVSEIQPLEEAVARSSRSPRIGTGRRLRHLAMFSRQLHVLISSGTPLVQALTACERQAEDARWRAVVKDIRETVEKGSPLSEAVRNHPRVFDHVCLSLIGAGEASGDMSSMLERMAQLMRKQLKLRNTVAGALIYPLTLIVVGVIVMLTMLMFVLPRFSDLFSQLDASLPPTTQFLMWLSATLWAYWWVIGPAALSVIAAAPLWVLKGSGARTIEDVALRAPKIGRVLQSLMTARVARMLGTLLESKVTLLASLKLCRESLAQHRYVELIAQAEAAVERGEPVSSVLSASPLIGAPVQEAIRTGEQSGRLGQPLLQMAEFLDEENDLVVTSIAKMIEPAILIGFGLLVGFVAISMFLPLFDLVSAAQGGGGH